MAENDDETNKNHSRKRRSAKPGYKWHHFLCSSRAQMEKPAELERAYHTLFRNSFGWEACQTIMKWAVGNDYISENFICNSDKFKKAFNILFGDRRKVEELILIISRDWTMPGATFYFENGKIHVIFDVEKMKRIQKCRSDLWNLLPLE